MTRLREDTTPRSLKFPKRVERNFRKGLKVAPPKLTMKIEDKSVTIGPSPQFGLGWYGCDGRQIWRPFP
jgi:hypothetical protein